MLYRRFFRKGSKQLEQGIMIRSYSFARTVKKGYAFCSVFLLRREDLNVIILKNEKNEKNFKKAIDNSISLWYYSKAVLSKLYMRV